MSIKAQVFSSDFLAASSIFLLVVGVIFFYWTYATKQIEETRNLNRMIEKTFTVSEVWLRNGFPEYWSSADVVDLGLGNGHKLNQTKLNSLSEIGYSNVKNLASIPEYNFLLKVYDDENKTTFSFGLFPSDAKNIVKVKRISILNESIVFVETLVWE